MSVEWWKRGIVYQIYPASFQDSNGDGWGDLEGIRSRLDYLAALGIDAIWISPIYPSPMKDCGYDIADYCGVDPRFGTLADFDALVAEAHARGLRVILDYVPNHTSDAHPWFQESRASRDAEKRDWYIWRDPKPGGGPPNNWLSQFGGSAWTFSAETGQYYYHAFLPEQPDLNWRNPRVRSAMFDVLRFWMKRGVDGFRVDVLWHLMKDPELRDNPPNPAYRPGDPSSRQLLETRSTDQRDVHEVVAEMRRVIDEFPDRLLIGEIYLPIERLVRYYGERGEGVHLPFNFHLILAQWDARAIAKIIEEYERHLPSGGWPNWVLGNHDQSRIATRVGPKQARVAAMLLLTLRGTPTMYYGDELGMTDATIAPEDARDGWAIRERGVVVSRDPQRTPMQWDATANGGFTTGRPWLASHAAYTETNVAALARQPDSILTLVRRLTTLRRAEPALAIGDKRLRVLDTPADVLGYERVHEDARWLVLLNLGSEERTVPIDAKGHVRLSTALDRDGETVSSELRLRGDEGVVIELE